MDAETKSRSGRGGKRPGAGRKPGVPSIARKPEVNELSERARKYTDEALRTLVAIAKRGKTESARVAAASALLDRGYGRPRQAVEVSGDAERPVAVAVVRTIVKPA